MDRRPIRCALHGDAMFLQSAVRPTTCCCYAPPETVRSSINTERLQLPAISELWNCFAERQMKIADAAAHEAIVISELVIGVGPICKARDCNS